MSTLVSRLLMVLTILLCGMLSPSAWRETPGDAAQEKITGVEGAQGRVTITPSNDAAREFDEPVSAEALVDFALRYDRLAKGMPKARVRALLGEPPRGVEGDRWVYQRQAGEAGATVIYLIIFEDGLVSGLSRSTYRPAGNP